ncbi:MAG: hypothetical protein KGJ08_02785 [Gammaproteobacteria bacterium]|nr:hypothetical protein [Gammaproteobacteria bacterium]
MKAYLTISGTIFGLLALWHVFELITHWRTLESDQWFTISTSAVIVLSGVLCIWAWVLLKLNRHRDEKSSAGSTLH